MISDLLFVLKKQWIEVLAKAISLFDAKVVINMAYRIKCYMAALGVNYISKSSVLLISFGSILVLKTFEMT